MGNSVAEAIEAFSLGNPVMIFDSDFRERETDLLWPAAKATPGIMRRLRKDCGGLLFLAIGDEIGEKLFVRSERQTLRALEVSGWILFTIRVQQTPLKNLIDARREDFINWIHHAPESFHRHKALRREQVKEIQKALD